MKKLSEYKDEAALDLLADLLEPFGRIFKDKEFVEEYGKEHMLKAVSIAIKKHKPDVMEILAIMEGVPVNEFHCTIATLPLRLIELLQDDALKQVFISQVQTNEG